MASIELKYKDEDFNDKVTSVEINFINQRMSSEYGKIVSDIMMLRSLNHAIETATEQKAEIIVNNSKEEAQRQIEVLENNLEEAKEQYMKLCNSDIVGRRRDLILLMLKANQCTDPMLFDKDFWEDSVDPAEVNEFMESCIMKGKKKEA